MRKFVIIFAVFMLCSVKLSAQATFTSKTDFSTLTRPYGIAIGDINGDGKSDIVIGHDNSPNVSVFLNTTTPGASTPTFGTRTDFATLNNAYSVTLADFNGDGKLDIAALNQGKIGVFLNTTTTGGSTPTFAARADFNGGGYWGIATGDFNGDGKPDIAATSQSSFTSILFNTTATGASTPTFATNVNYTVGQYPTAVTVADFNMDGKPDFATANDDNGPNGNDVSVLLNTAATGASSPSFSTRTDFACQINPTTVVSGDLNNDGKPDLAASNSGSSTISVFFNTTTPGASTPSFTAGSTFATGSGPFSIAFADFNNDGKPDLLAADINVSKVSVLLNTTTNGSTTPSFATKTDFTTGTNPYYASGGDFNNDGKPDIISTNKGGASISILMNTMTTGVSASSFSSKTDFTTGSSPAGILLRDFNNDAKTDAAVVNTGADNFSLMLNATTTGGSTPEYNKTDFSTSSGPSAIHAGDFNGDGKQDIAVAIYNSEKVSVYMNTTSVGSGTPAFSSATDFTTGALPHGITVADYNGDGKPDFCTANNTPTNTLSVFFNTTTPGASTPTFTSKTDFSTSAAPNSLISADINNDGLPDIIAALAGTPGLAAVYLNTTTPGSSTPSFSAATEFNLGTNPKLLAAGDLNGDGKIDIASANSSSENVSVILNTTTPGSSTPAFSSKSDFTAPSGSSPNGIVIYDVNGDGKKDVLFTAGTVTTVSVYINTAAINAGTASFGSRSDLTAGTNPQSIAFGEVNGDGKPDIVLGNNGGGDISVLLNSADLPLPVELVSFNAVYRSGTVSLSWQTATEVNNYGFSVERFDVQNQSGWETIGFVAGAGNSNSSKNYSFTDKISHGGLIRYRLKQIDTDGKYDYSPVVEVGTNENTSFSLAQNFPNPFNPETTISFTLNKSSHTSLRLYSALGEQVLELINGMLNAGEHSYRLDASGLSAGVYYYTLSTESFSKTRQMILLK